MKHTKEKKKIDIRNIQMNQTVKSSGWLITRVVGGWLYREVDQSFPGIVYIPWVRDILKEDMIIEIDE